MGVLGAFVLMAFSTLSLYLFIAMWTVFGPWCWMLVMPSMMLAVTIGDFFAHK